MSEATKLSVTTLNSEADPKGEGLEARNNRTAWFAGGSVVDPAAPDDGRHSLPYTGYLRTGVGC
jgi:hypothetical protein